MTRRALRIGICIAALGLSFAGLLYKFDLAPAPAYDYLRGTLIVPIGLLFLVLAIVPPLRPRLAESTCMALTGLVLLAVLNQLVLWSVTIESEAVLSIVNVVTILLALGLSTAFHVWAVGRSQLRDFMAAAQFLAVLALIQKIEIHPEARVIRLDNLLLIVPVAYAVANAILHFRTRAGAKE